MTSRLFDEMALRRCRVVNGCLFVPIRIVFTALTAVSLLGGISCQRDNDTKRVLADQKPDTRSTEGYSGQVGSWPTRPKYHDVVDAVTGVPASVVVYLEATHLPSWNSDWPRLILAIWSDGRVVCSRDTIQGGEPYVAGSSDAKDVQALIGRLTSHAVSANVKPRTRYCGPSYPSTHIFFRTGDGHMFEIDSWHEYQEHDSQRVFNGKVWVSLNAGQTINEILAGADDRYVSFRSLWVLLRQNVDAMVPASVQPTTASTFRFVNTREAK